MKYQISPVSSNASSYKDITSQTENNVSGHKGINDFSISKDNFYVYRITDSIKESTGLIAAVLIGEAIKTHEKVFEKKVHRYTDMLLEDNTQNMPAMLFYPQQQQICEIVANETRRPADEIKQVESSEHKIWKIMCSNTNSKLMESLQGINDLYVADGHHRLAATTNLVDYAVNQFPNVNKRQNNYISLLAALFPHTEIDILPYNRGCMDLNGMTPVEFLQVLENDFVITATDTSVYPSENIEFGMFIGGNWYLLRLKYEHSSFAFHENAPGVDTLESIIFKKILDVKDIEKDQRVVFIDGSQTDVKFERYISFHQVAVGFIFKPVNVEELMDIAEKGEYLSPHSTWFVPRLTHDLVLHDVGLKKQLSFQADNILQEQHESRKNIATQESCISSKRRPILKSELCEHSV